jgi:hypothetical protein
LKSLLTFIYLSLYLFIWWDWSLNLVLCVYKKVGALPVEPLPVHFVLVILEKLCAQDGLES